jgi:hypothetical protein
VRELVRDREEMPVRVKLLLEMQAHPPLFLREAIGPAPIASPKKGRAELRLSWSRVALAIVDYRAGRGITDPVDALGPRTTQFDPDRQVVQQRIDRYNAERTATRALKREVER